MFTTPLVLRALTADLWAIDAPLVWTDGAGTISVPQGFITDMASIPRVFRNLVLTDPDGISRRAACLHDWIYSGYRTKGKAFADDTLRAALISDGMSEAGAAAYYYAVHWFGGSSWAGDGNRHPYALSPSNLENVDFDTEADWNAWMATCPTPNECLAPGATLT